MGTAYDTALTFYVTSQRQASLCDCSRFLAVLSCYTYCLFKINVLIGLADSPTEMIIPAMVPVCCLWHAETETTLTQLFAVSSNSLDTGAIPGMTL